MPVLTPLNHIPKVGEIVVYQGSKVMVNEPAPDPIRYEVLGHDPDTKQIIVISDVDGPIEKMREVYKERNRNAVDDPNIPITCIICRFGVYPENWKFNTLLFTES